VCSVSHTIRAAGGVLVRDGLVAVVHRPRYDDWSLPKGKLLPGELEVDAARREVLEETGHQSTIVADLGTVEYTVLRRGEQRPKTVRYYLMDTAGGEFVPHDEVDALRWVEPREAERLLSYARDREVLARARNRERAPGRRAGD
jgi:8-oxo-dGTP pyrophosphatase MutT (NUDIX family)